MKNKQYLLTEIHFTALNGKNIVKELNSLEHDYKKGNYVITILERHGHIRTKALAKGKCKQELGSQWVHREKQKIRINSNNNHS